MALVGEENRNKYKKSAKYRVKQKISAQIGNVAAV
jgi:hypothetical protein